MSKKSKTEEQEPQEVQGSPEETVEVPKVEEAPPKKLGKMHPMAIYKLFGSWSIFKGVGSGPNNAYKLKLIDTDYVLHILPKTNYTWQVRWSVNAFKDVTVAKRVKVEHEVSFREVYENSPEEYKKIFDENISLFLVPKGK